MTGIKKVMSGCLRRGSDFDVTPRAVKDMLTLLISNCNTFSGTRNNLCLARTVQTGTVIMYNQHRIVIVFVAFMADGRMVIRKINEHFNCMRLRAL